MFGHPRRTSPRSCIRLSRQRSYPVGVTEDYNIEQQFCKSISKILKKSVRLWMPSGCEQVATTCSLRITAKDFTDVLAKLLFDIVIFIHSLDKIFASN